MQRGTFSVTVAALVFVCAARPVRADECGQGAHSEFRSCHSTCRDDFNSAKFACRGVDPTCGTACLAGRMACFDDVNTILETGQLPGGGTLDNCTDGTDGCMQRLAAAKTACGAPCKGDSTCTDCVDSAQVTNFLCRDACRDSWRSNPTVVSMNQNCRDTFQTCVHACPPAP